MGWYSEQDQSRKNEINAKKRNKYATDKERFSLALAAHYGVEPALYRRLSNKVLKPAYKRLQDLSPKASSPVPSLAPSPVDLSTKTNTSDERTIVAPTVSPPTSTKINTSPAVSQPTLIPDEGIEIENDDEGIEIKNDNEGIDTPTPVETPINNVEPEAKWASQLHLEILDKFIELDGDIQQTIQDKVARMNRFAPDPPASLITKSSVNKTEMADKNEDISKTLFHETPSISRVNTSTPTNPAKISDDASNAMASNATSMYGTGSTLSEETTCKHHWLSPLDFDVLEMYLGLDERQQDGIKNKIIRMMSNITRLSRDIRPEGDRASLINASNMTRVPRDPDECINGTPTAPQDAVTITPPFNQYPPPRAPQESELIVDRSNAPSFNEYDHIWCRTKLPESSVTVGLGQVQKEPGDKEIEIENDDEEIEIEFENSNYDEDIEIENDDEEIEIEDEIPSSTPPSSLIVLGSTQRCTRSCSQNYGKMLIPNSDRVQREMRRLGSHNTSPTRKRRRRAKEQKNKDNNNKPKSTVKAKRQKEAPSAASSDCKADTYSLDPKTAHTKHHHDSEDYSNIVELLIQNAEDKNLYYTYPRHFIDQIKFDITQFIKSEKGYQALESLSLKMRQLEHLTEIKNLPWGTKSKTKTKSFQFVDGTIIQKKIFTLKLPLNRVKCVSVRKNIVDLGCIEGRHWQDSYDEWTAAYKGRIIDCGEIPSDCILVVLFVNQDGHLDGKDPNYIVVTPIELSETDLLSLGEKYKEEVLRESWGMRSGSSGGYVYSDTDSKALSQCTNDGLMVGYKSKPGAKCYYQSKDGGTKCASQVYNLVRMKRINRKGKEKFIETDETQQRALVEECRSRWLAIQLLREEYGVKLSLGGFEWAPSSELYSKLTEDGLPESDAHLLAWAADTGEMVNHSPLGFHMDRNKSHPLETLTYFPTIPSNVECGLFCANPAVIFKAPPGKVSMHSSLTKVIHASDQSRGKCNVSRVFGPH